MAVGESAYLEPHLLFIEVRAFGLPQQGFIIRPLEKRFQVLEFERFPSWTEDRHLATASGVADGDRFQIASTGMPTGRCGGSTRTENP
jgi:hypothetical protein